MRILPNNSRSQGPPLHFFFDILGFSGFFGFLCFFGLSSFFGLRVRRSEGSQGIHIFQITEKEVASEIIFEGRVIRGAKYLISSVKWSVVSIERSMK